MIYLVIVVILMIAAGIVLEVSRRKTPVVKADPNHPSADQAGPTQTGKYRVKQMMERTAQTRDTEAKQNAAQKPATSVPDDEMPLPPLPGDE